MPSCTQRETLPILSNSLQHNSYFTGSDLFNTQMRLIALEKGFTLNEYEVCRLTDDGTKGPPIKVKTERDMCVRFGSALNVSPAHLP